MQVDVVIPVHGNWEITRRCLDSLAQPDRCVRAIIVVDDASSDETARELRARPGITPIVLENNRGFSGACNEGAQRAGGDAVLFLNNDTIVPPGSIDTLAAALAADETIGAAGPKLLYADGTIQSAGCTFTKGAGGSWRLYAHLDGDLPQANVRGDFPYLAGAALLVRTEMFRALGGFDERFRNGAEDVDLCLRIWRGGKRVQYVPGASIYHIEGATRGKVTDEDTNWLRLREVWGAALDRIPSFDPRAPASLVVDFRAQTPVEHLVRNHFARTLGDYAGARVTFSDSAFAAPVERVRAALERRAAVTLGYNSPRAANIELDPRRTRPGFFETDRPQGEEIAVVTDASVPLARSVAIQLALRPLPARLVDLDRLDIDALAALRAAAHVIFAGYGDAWGFIGGERLAAGARVVAPRGAPFLEILPDDVAVICDLDAVADAAAQVRSDPDAYAAMGERARRESLRRAPALYAGERVRELARAYAYGLPDPERFAIAAV